MENQPNFQKKIYNILDLIIKPEKCGKCQQWMPIHKVVTDNYKHESLERKCEDEECK